MTNCPEVRDARRKTCGSPLRRTILAAATAIVIVAWGGVSPPLTLAIALVGILAVIVFEQRTDRPKGSMDARSEDGRHIGGTAV